MNDDDLKARIDLSPQNFLADGQPIFSKEQMAEGERLRLARLHYQNEQEIALRRRQNEIKAWIADLSADGRTMNKVDYLEKDMRAAQEKVRQKYHRKAARLLTHPQYPDVLHSRILPFNAPAAGIRPSTSTIGLPRDSRPIAEMSLEPEPASAPLPGPIAAQFPESPAQFAARAGVA